MHKRTFVGTLLAAVATTVNVGGGSGETISPPSAGLPNNTGGDLTSGRAVAVDPTGVIYADATTSSAISLIGILTAPLLDGTDATDIVSGGYAPGVITGLGFTAGDEIYLGTSGQLIDKTAALALPPGAAIKEVGIAYNTTDLWVQIGNTEIV